jgi:predicted nucleotidyltransferase
MKIRHIVEAAGSKTTLGGFPVTVLNIEDQGVEEGKKPEHNLGTGWMLDKDKALGQKVDQARARYSELYKTAQRVDPRTGKKMVQKGVAEDKQPGKPVVDAILKVVPIAQEIWFHGSRATGKHRKNSDTDILVVVPDDLVGDQYLGVVRILQKLSRHFDNYDIQPTHPGYNIHLIAQEEGRLLWSNKQDVAENFADGRHPEDKGDSARHGIPKKATMAELEKASHAKGRKGQLARWQLNMRRGHKK